jgi:hypothetical protein
MLRASRLLAANPDYTKLKLEFSRTRNQAYGSQFVQLPTKKAGQHRSGRQSWSATVVLHDVLAYLIIVPNGDFESETVRP